MRPITDFGKKGQTDKNMNFIHKCKVPPGLLGSPTETPVCIQGKTIKALLDTGSTVSTISRSYYQQNLANLDLNPMEDILNIECAGGQMLPYDGFIEVDISLTNIGGPYTCMLLVIPDSPYNSQVPLLLGTNVLNTIMEECRNGYGERFLQTAKLTTPWFTAFRSIVLREKELSRNNNKLAIVKFAGNANIIIPPNTNITLPGYLDKQLQYCRTSAMIHPTTSSILPSDLDVAPSLIEYEYHQTNEVSVEVSNVTTRTVNVSPHAILCEIQPVTIEDDTQKEKTEFSPPLLEQVKMDIANLTTEQMDIGKELIMAYQDIFSKGDSDMGHTDMVEHRIELDDQRPFKQKYRRIPPSMFDEVRSHLQILLRNGIIRKSHSPWSSNVVLVRKKDKSLRMCVDFRQLNQRSIKDAYALPRIEEILDCFAGNKYFSTVDMKSGYHQVEIFEPHKERTAFTVGPLGFFEFCRMPFGLSNSPATYQRLMQDCLADLHLKICCIFIDDVIIYARTFEEHQERLKLVFDRIRTACLKLAPGKCRFFKPKVKYVGHIVSEAGVETDPEKIEKIIKWPTPETPEQVRQFIGFAGYYRRFIRNFSQISKPLTELMPTPAKKSKKKTHIQKSWNWGQQQEQSFLKLKELLSTAPILGYADYTKSFEVHTDASGLGLGAVLYQNQEGQNRVIAYASRGLSKSEKNYPAHKLEFLALKWSVCDKFHDYLYGHSFGVLTDNNPLTYVLTSANLDATGHRWLAALSVYDFNITYRPGKNNADADGLSRMPTDTIAQESIKAICGVMRTPLVETLAVTPDVLDQPSLDTEHQIYNDIDWVSIQHQDKELKPWIDYVREGKKPKRGQVEQSPLLRQFEHLKLTGNILYRVIRDRNGNEIRQLVLPSSHVTTVLKTLHDEMGHPGRDRTTSLIRDRFYWPGMSRDIDIWLGNCDRCMKRKKEPGRAPLVSITTTQPLELVCIDFLTLEQSKGGQQNILVVTDHFTRYAQAYPTRNQTAKTTAEILFHHFIVNYGIPKRIHSDQGANFTGNLIQELCKLLGVKKSRTTPYHAMGNGMTERFNRTLLSMLGTLEPYQKLNWKLHVGSLVHAYNCTKHESTHQSPYFLMFGREPQLPIDLAFGLVTEKQRKPQTKFVQELRERLLRAYELASENSRKAQSRQKEGYDLRARGAIVEKGDKVLVRKVAFEGKHKIADKWEDNIYIVLDQPNLDIPVFRVQKEDGTGRIRTLHRNLLLPIGYISEEATSRPIPKPRKRNKIRSPEKQKQRSHKTPDLTFDDSSFEEEYPFIIPDVNTECYNQH